MNSKTVFKLMAINKKHLAFLIVASPAIALLSHCASKVDTTEMTEIVVYNTGSYPMQSPQVCYYQGSDPKTCQTLDVQDQLIHPGSSQQFSIRANEKVRLVFPFDHMLRFSGVMYRPNCHMLADFTPAATSHYHFEAQIKAQALDPEKGFNCALKPFEEILATSEKLPMKDTIKQHIRYRVPRKGEMPDDYVSNYHWQ